MEQEIEKESLKILFEIKNDDGTKESETLWATKVRPNTFRLDNSPFYVYGVSWRDIIEARINEKSGFVEYRKVLEKSGNRTIRILFERNIEPNNNAMKQLDDLVSMGCSYEGAYAKLISLTIPPEIELTSITNYLVGESMQWEYADPTYEEINSKGS